MLFRNIALYRSRPRPYILNRQGPTIKPTCTVKLSDKPRPTEIAKVSLMSYPTVKTILMNTNWQ